MTTKLSVDEKAITLPVFMRQLESALKQRGMLYLFYLVATYVSVGKSLSNMLQNYPLYDPKTIVSQIKAGMRDSQRSLPDGTNVNRSAYDQYDLKNLYESHLFIWNSLDDGLQEEIRPFLSEDPSGPEVIAHVLLRMLPNSYRRNDQLLEDLKSLSLKDQPGENVIAYNQKALHLCQELRKGNALPANAIMIMHNLVTHSCA